MMNIRNLGSKESLGVKFKEGICTELHLKFWFESERFVDMVRVPYLHSISRNYSNKFLLINLQKTKSSKALQQRLFVLVLGFWQCRKDFVHYLKVASATFLLVCFLSLKESTFETSKNVFYFASKAFYVLEKIKV